MNLGDWNSFMPKYHRTTTSMHKLTFDELDLFVFMVTASIIIKKSSAKKRKWCTLQRIPAIINQNTYAVEKYVSVTVTDLST